MIMRKMKTKGKILTLFISVILIFSVIVNGLIYIYFNNYVTDTTLRSNADLARELINQKYEGSWSVKDGQLYKGDTLMNDNVVAVDSVKKVTGAECTLFLNDIRVTTTVMNNNQRAVGTASDPSIVSEVIDEAKEYRGEAEVAGEAYLSIYMPIETEDNTIIGMIFIGIPKAVVEEDVFGLLLEVIKLTIMLVIISMIVVTLFVHRTVTKPLKRMKVQLGSMAEGDLTFTISEKELKKYDEFGDSARSLEQTRESMKNMVSVIKQNSQDIDSNSETLSQVSEEMASAATDVSNSIHNIAKGAGEQAEELVYISELTNAFGDKLEDIVEVFEEINENTHAINEFADQSASDMDALAKSMNLVLDTSKTNSENMKQWGEKIDKISDISAVINGIASQTNLLALNAAIEAARAGEAGKGFAVVADEIRKLAEESRKSSENITMLVGDVVQNGDSMIKGSVGMGEELENEIKIVEVAIESFEKIRAAINKIVPKMQEVNDASEQLQKDKNTMIDRVGQAASVSEEVSASTQEINAVSEEMNASTEEVASTAQNLTALTAKMLDNVNKFKL